MRHFITPLSPFFFHYFDIFFFSPFLFFFHYWLIYFISFIDMALIFIISHYYFIMPLRDISMPPASFVKILSFHFFLFIFVPMTLLIFHYFSLSFSSLISSFSHWHHFITTFSDIIFHFLSFYWHYFHYYYYAIIFMPFFITLRTLSYYADESEFLTHYYYFSLLFSFSFHYYIIITIISLFLYFRHYWHYCGKHYYFHWHYYFITIKHFIFLTLLILLIIRQPMMIFCKHFLFADVFSRFLSPSFILHFISF